MEQSPSWETVASSAGLEIPGFLWKRDIHYHIHKSSPLIPIMNQISPDHVLPSYWLKIHFNGILPSTPRASQWPLSFRFPNQIFCGHFFLLTYNMPLLSRLSWLDHPNGIWWGVQFVEFLNVQFSPSLFFLHFVPKYLSQHTVFEHLHFVTYKV
jgi:hypothetical protein